MRVVSCLAASLIAGLAPLSAHGQGSRQLPPATDFSELRALVRLRDPVVVRIESGEEIRASVIAVDAVRNVIVLDADQVRLSLPESGIREIHLQVRDPLGNGTLRGIGLGLATAVLLAAISDDGGGGRGFLAYSLFAIPIGAGVGAGIDAMHHGRQLVFERPATFPGVLSLLDRQELGGFRFSLSHSW